MECERESVSIARPRARKLSKGISIVSFARKRVAKWISIFLKARGK
jgi:hypothetical protein